MIISESIHHIIYLLHCQTGRTIFVIHVGLEISHTCEYYNCDNLVDARYDKTKCEYDDRKHYCTQHRPEYSKYNVCIECGEHRWGKNPKGLKISDVGFSRICKGGRYKCHTCINECREYGSCSGRRGGCGCYMESRR